MTKPLLLITVLASLFLATGCGLFSKKSDRVKENPAIASEVEETFRRRWVDKRVAELTAQGAAAAAARTQAEGEFHEKYGFSNKPKK